ncbi:MAG: hypothetical protein ACRD1D_11335 [Acidimicrobiales bacterium]
MKRLTRPAVAAIGAFLAVLALGGTALAATTVSVTLGPVPVPGVPVEVCVEQTDVGANQCVTGPAGETVTLTVTVTLADAGLIVVPPTIAPVPCPAGTGGLAAQVTTGTAGATVGGSVTVTGNGRSVTLPVAQTVLTPNQTLTVYACAGLAPGA